MPSYVKILNPVSKFLLITLLIGLSFHVNAQTYYFENYSVRQGLPNSKIYDILQDHDGYIWLASPSGLIRFDGEDFKSYGIVDGISENTVRALLLDSQNRLWIGFENGQVYVKVKDSFQLIINDSINPKGEVSDITQNRKGDIVVSTNGSIPKFLLVLKVLWLLYY